MGKGLDSLKQILGPPSPVSVCVWGRDLAPDTRRAPAGGIPRILLPGKEARQRSSPNASEPPLERALPLEKTGIYSQDPGICLWVRLKRDRQGPDLSIFFLLRGGFVWFTGNPHTSTASSGPSKTFQTPKQPAITLEKGPRYPQMAFLHLGSPGSAWASF